MRRSVLFWLLTIFILFFLGLTVPAQANVTTIRLGEVTSITVSENETTPYRWLLVLTDESVLELVGEAYIQDPNPLDMCGVGGNHRFDFSAIGAGLCSVDMYLVRIGDTIDEAVQKECYIYIVEEADGLAGAWRTAEDDGEIITLLLYPADAFRLYRYHEGNDETFMLEGARAVEVNEIIVSDIRLGILDSDGVYTQAGEKDILHFTFLLELDGTPALTLTDEEGDTITLYPVDLDSPG